MVDIGPLNFSKSSFLIAFGGDNLVVYLPVISTLYIVSKVTLFRGRKLEQLSLIPFELNIEWNDFYNMRVVILSSFLGDVSYLKSRLYTDRIVRLNKVWEGLFTLRSHAQSGHMQYWS